MASHSTSARLLRKVDRRATAPGAASTAPARATLARWGPGAILAAVGGAMLAWTWLSWPDVIVDFGGQLYLPWQVAQGKVLYRDIAYYNGPWSVYFNAGVFKLLGTSLMSLVVSNLAWMAGLVACLFWLLSRATGRWTATAACGVFLLLFGFAQYILCGNYNYVCPYSHELTHGLTLLMLATVLLWRLSLQPVRAAAVAGLVLGVLGSKVELFIPSLVSVCATLALGLWTVRAPKASWCKAYLAMAGAMLAGPLASWAALSLAMPVDQALRGALGSWVPLAEPKLRGLLFYRRLIGLDEPWVNARSMLWWLGAYAAVLAPALAASLLWRKWRRLGWALSIAAAVGTAGALLAVRGRIDWLMAGKCWPALLAILAAVHLVGLRKLPDQRRRAGAIWLSMVVLAWALSMRLALNCRVWHYGFIYAMPAALVVTCWLLHVLPGAIERRGGLGRAVRLTAALVLVLAGAMHLVKLSAWLGEKTLWVGSGPDAFRTDWVRGPAVVSALRQLERTTAPTDRLVVLPEGVMLNYLARRENPIAYANFMPPEMILFGEQRMLGALAANPPELTALVAKGTSEYGFAIFGRDYGRDIARFVNANYRPLFTAGGKPFVQREFGISFFRRIGVAAPAPHAPTAAGAPALASASVSAPAAASASGTDASTRTDAPASATSQPASTVIDRITPWGWAALVIAAVLIGVSKTGLPGIGILAVTLVAVAIPAKQSTGLILPMLIVGDLFAVAFYRRHAVWAHLLRLLPFAVVGILIGYWAMDRLSDRLYSPVIGSIVLVMLAMNYLRTRRATLEQEIPQGWWFPAVMGTLAGVTTMMANAAGPIMVVYLLAMRLPKTGFIGTAAWYFLLVNCFKVPFSADLSLINPQTLGLNLLLSPLIVAGAVLGIVVARRLPERVFAVAVQVLAALGAAKLLLS